MKNRFDLKVRRRARVDESTFSSVYSPEPATANHQRRIALICSLVLVAFLQMFTRSLSSAEAASSPVTVEAADGAVIHFQLIGNILEIRYTFPPETAAQGPLSIFLALGEDQKPGSAVLPFGEKTEGSPVFLPFRAHTFFCSEVAPDRQRTFRRQFDEWQWSDRVDFSSFFPVQVNANEYRLLLPLGRATPQKRQLVLYAKDFKSDPWGQIVGCIDPGVRGGRGDKYIPHYYEVEMTAPSVLKVGKRARHRAEDRVLIYQLLVRQFGNTTEQRKSNGTLQENGTGKFNDINDAALKSLREMGFTHVWLTGVLQQATASDYSSVGQPGDDPDLLKGLAGSPYAIKDYFDVSPDYAKDPAKRMDEFKSLLDRMHKHQLQALIDFVPNHVARSYGSDVKPEHDFGAKGQKGKGDDTSRFFDPQNNFFYLEPGKDGPPLKLPTVKDGKVVSPTCEAVAALYADRPTEENGGHPPSRRDGTTSRPPLQACDGLFEPETEIGRVTGNNVVSWTPSLGDWYETVKLNYGFDFNDTSKKRREYPNALTPEKAIPDTWHKMDAVLAYWQSLGVDGFRCDMAHMVPPEFWSWAIERARSRNPEVFFVAEAYDDDPAKVPGSDPVISKLNGGKPNVMTDLLNAGFNAVYDDPTYDTIKKIYEGPAWANDIDPKRHDPFVFDNSLRYAENHDEARLAAPSQWGGHGRKAGFAISAILYGLSRGPAMLYNGQEVGEPAEGVEGFGGDDARTSIFDYWSMPQLTKWVNGHKYDGGKLSADEKQLQTRYSRLVKAAAEPAFRRGAFFPLNAANNSNTSFGTLKGETAGGHWVYAFIRHDPESKQRFLGVVNLHPNTSFKDVVVKLSAEATAALQLPEGQLRLEDRLGSDLKLNVSGAELVKNGIKVPELAAATPYYFEIVEGTR